MNADNISRTRLEELLVDYVTQGLAPDAQETLREALPSFPSVSLEEYEAAAALLATALLRVGPMPEMVRARLDVEAEHPADLWDAA